MRAVVQRVSEASVSIGGKEVARIGRGLLILLGIEDADGVEDLEWLAVKLAKLRIFSDAEGKMNAGIADVEGRALVVSQFTLHAMTKKGNRPSFIRAARPEVAVPLGAYTGWNLRSGDGNTGSGALTCSRAVSNASPP